MLLKTFLVFCMFDFILIIKKSLIRFPLEWLWLYFSCKETFRNWFCMCVKCWVYFTIFRLSTMELSVILFAGSFITSKEKDFRPWLFCLCLMLALSSVPIAFGSQPGPRLAIPFSLSHAVDTRQAGPKHLPHWSVPWKHCVSKLSHWLCKLIHYLS